MTVIADMPMEKMNFTAKISITDTVIKDIVSSTITNRYRRSSQRVRRFVESGSLKQDVRKRKNASINIQRILLPIRQMRASNKTKTRTMLC